ncbi:hypothetical protein [Caminicella sporogenes]|uniref:hypothetical protein n=1 Tax=Caminicella sporogenes TaxID=166485 RepID=UPI0025417C2F|nr:hypothetical protein [Caminicella sporogenes]WIF95147.1 hypothetical protein QNI18_00465 [Caminicella sporogenes]
MNRAMRRKKEKMLKRSLTKEQFERLHDEAINLVVQRKVGEIWQKMSPFLIKAMRNNRVSEERVAKIINEFYDMVQNEFGEGGNDSEGLSKC